MEILIGRASSNDIVIDDKNVSRWHCKVSLNEKGEMVLKDLRSLNGTRMNQIKVTKEVVVKPSDKVQISSTILSGSDLLEAFEKKKQAELRRRKELDELRRQAEELERNAREEKKVVEEKERNVLAKCEEIKRKYDGFPNRYRNDLNELLGAVEISKEPFVLQFPSEEVKIEYYVKEYNKQMSAALPKLELISKSSRKDALIFRDDMDLLGEYCKKAGEEQQEQCLEIRELVFDQITSFQKDALQKVNTAIQELSEYYQNIFSPYYETTATHDLVWKSFDNKRIIALPYLLYGYKDVTCPLFEDSFQFQCLQFVPFLNRKNILLRYNNNTSRVAQDVVNGLLGRLLAGSQSGNVQLWVFDPKDLGGTSNVFKMLDHHVYTIYARTSDMQSQLSMLDRYVENVVQNLLQGPYTSLAEFNQGKEKQEPYQVIVFKDFPFGITPDMAHTIQRIIVNGLRSGVQFVFMLNDDMMKNSEDCTKVGDIMHLDQSSSVQAIEIDLTKQPDNIREKQQFAGLDDNMMHGIVQYVNAGFEIKTEEVLRLTDYMIPKEEWWTKQSANRADIPFGMSTNKQIQRLNITQESGQNAAVVIGIPGSGKSVFLHTLIANAMVNYSPRELQMYLLDFSGVEFDVYARHKLPHARVIAPEAEREFGLSILKEVYEEGNRRMTLCRENGVTNIVELKRKNPDLIVPRLLVIIDEFQKIFEIENDNISKDANAKIHAIIQEYRKFGINLILATQKLPAKSIVPYDLIANRVVFKSDPNDFNNLIKWSHALPQPRLFTGTCVYNNESGAEVANYLTRSFFINASKELEELLDEVKQFADQHPEMADVHDLRTFRSEELPEYQDRILSDRHYGQQEDAPREVGVYLGESIAIAPCHVYVPLTKDSYNNILIIGGVPNIAKGVAYHTLLSEITAHTERSCNVILMNFMMDDDPMQSMFQSEMFAAVSDYCTLKEVKSEEDARDYMRFIIENVIEARKKDPSLPMSHFFINIFEFQRGRMFDGTGGRGDMQSECSMMLEYILKNGPMVGVFTVLQVDNLANLNRLGFNAQNMFCHRVTMQMSEQDSNKIVGNSAANKLLVLNRPATNYRGLYYNNINNSITKFKPYRYGSNSNQQ